VARWVSCLYVWPYVPGTFVRLVSLAHLPCIYLGCSPVCKTVALPLRSAPALFSGTMICLPARAFDGGTGRSRSHCPGGRRDQLMIRVRFEEPCLVMRARCLDAVTEVELHSMCVMCVLTVVSLM